MTVQADVSEPCLRVSVVIPALNEARNLPYVLGRLPPDIHEVIVVDGHSVDDTIAVARQSRPGVRIRGCHGGCYRDGRRRRLRRSK